MNSGVSIHMAIGSLISTVIPVFNEEESIPKLFDELTSVANENNYELEVIFVDDGSTDSSWDEIEKLAAESNHVKAIRFRRNFGKADALNAGFEIATGHVVFTLDADLQDDPIEIPRFLEKMQKESIDVISGWKK
jgi:glycosyltransferase involved in cell wall biosynthesis